MIADAEICTHTSYDYCCGDRFLYIEGFGHAAC